MDLGLKGKVAVVTGGSEGIGRAAAQSLGREGASVVVCALSEAEEVGDLIAFLCSTRGAYISGVSIHMDGGTSAVV